MLRAPGLPLPETSFARHGRAVASLLPLLRAADQRRRELDHALARAMQAAVGEEERGGQPRVAEFLLSRPGIGNYVASTLLAEAPEALLRGDYHALRALAGVAPVTRSSGKKRHVNMRRACNPRLRNALFHWARCACQNDEAVRELYDRLRARGKFHARALRGVGDRLLERLCAEIRGLARKSGTEVQPASPAAA